MPTPSFTSFNAGELSPLMEGRVDFAKYASGCQSLLNFTPTVQGPARRRPGSVFVNEVKSSDQRTWLWRFEFNVDQAFILEFGNLYIRFYTDHGVVLSGMSAYEIASPYTTADLINADGTFALSMVQSADVIYIAHPNYQPYKLARFANTNWTMSPLDQTGGPFDDVNLDDSITITASAVTGVVTLTASAAIFTADDIGSLFYMEQKDASEYKSWEVNRIFNLGDKAASDGKYYEATSAALPGDTEQYSGTVRPTHTSGRAFDGSRTSGPVQQATSQTIGVEWEYLHAGFGWGRITAVGGGGTTATMTVLSRLPDYVVTNATSKWAYADWSERYGYPSHVTFFRDRLTFAGRQKLWFSVTGDYENFQPKRTNTVSDDDAINIRISSDQVNDITWLSSGEALLIGTAGGEFACTENSSSDPFATRNAKITQQGRYGGRSVAPVQVSASTLFVQAAGRKLRQLTYSFNQDNYASTDLTVLSEHITAGGIVQMAYQQEPDSIIWCALGNGKLVGFTYNTEQDVAGWHRHDLNGIVESIQVISTPDGTSKELWLVVRRTINGQTKRYVEYLSQPWREEDGIEAARYVDSSLEYLGAPTTTISGLDHLEGETVTLLVDGATHPDRTVSGGSITLQIAGSHVFAGIGYSSALTTMRIEWATRDGTGQSKQKKFSQVNLRFISTVGGKYGYADKLDIIFNRTSAMPMNQAVEPFSGDREVQWPIGWERDGRLTILQDQPLPMTLAGIYPDVKVSS